MIVPSEKSVFTIRDLVYLMMRLRKPETGCPWDIKQDFHTIVSHTLEEAYEVVDAIERSDFDHLREELGDLLFQVIFYSQMAKEEGLFDFDEVIHALTRKLITRHPHVFPDGTITSERKVGDDPEQGEIKKNWEKLKAKDRQNKGTQECLADIPQALPALSRAEKLQKRASNHGFDWPDYRPVLDKIDEELVELKEAVDLNNLKHVEEELGDLIFSCVNLGRHKGLDLEACLRRANNKFEVRFRAMELIAEKNKVVFEALTLTEKNALWQQVKQAEQDSVA